MRSKFRTAVVYDLETGGLDGDVHPITEIALVAINLESLEIIDEYTDLVKPYKQLELYTADSLEVSHISIEMLEKDGKSIDEVIKNTAEFLAKHADGNSKPILAGHNIERFDNTFLFREFKERKIDLAKLINPDKMIDTLKYAQLMWSELPNFSLGSCANAVGITIKGAHRALADTVANAKLLIKMLANLRSGGTASETYVRKKYSVNY